MRVLALVALLGAALVACYPKVCDPNTDPTRCTCPPGVCGPYPDPSPPPPTRAGDAGAGTDAGK